MRRERGIEGQGFPDCHHREPCGGRGQGLWLSFCGLFSGGVCREFGGGMLV